MTKVRLYESIRKTRAREGLGVRALARKFKIHRRTVREALASALPPPRKITQREAPALGPFKGIIAEWLLADAKAPRKQRHTGNRIWQRLVEEHGCTAAASTVRREVARLRRDLASHFQDAYVPQCHAPGQEAEVDFYEAIVRLGGTEVRLHHFCMRACHSGREFHQAFFRPNQQAFLEAHNEALAYFGGVFALLRYDNLSAAVKKVLQGRKREETDRFVALRSHYGFDSLFCLPGIQGAHEKGGVENAQGRFRRAHLVPVPDFPDLTSYNAHLLACCAKDDQRTPAQGVAPILEAWARDQGALGPLPTHPFDTDTVVLALVDAHGRVRAAGHRYSVPIRLHGQRVEVRISAREVRCTHQGQEVARHQRLHSPGAQSLLLDHYLDLLKHKPGALPGALALHQARAAGAWPDDYDQLWQALTRRHGQAEGTRQMVEVLLLHRSYPKAKLKQAASLALERGCLEAAAVAHLAQELGREAPIVAPLGDLGDLAKFEMALPSLAEYDTLLGLAS